MKKTIFWSTNAHLAWTLGTPSSEFKKKFDDTLSSTEQKEFKVLHDRYQSALIAKCCNVPVSQVVLKECASNAVGLGEDVYNYCLQHPDEIISFAPQERFSDVFPTPQSLTNSVIPTSLKDVRVLIVGVLSEPQGNLYQKIIKAGGKKASGIYSTTKIVVAGARSGHNRIEAAKRGIPVLTEKAFTQMFGL